MEEKIIEASKKSARLEMLPWVGVAVAGASALTAGVIKLYDFFKKKKAASEAEIEAAKTEIINGIKEYDALHEHTESGLKQQ